MGLANRGIKKKRSRGKKRGGGSSLRREGLDSAEGSKRACERQKGRSLPLSGKRKEEEFRSVTVKREEERSADHLLGRKREKRMGRTAWSQGTLPIVKTEKKKGTCSVKKSPAEIATSQSLLRRKKEGKGKGAAPVQILPPREGRGGGREADVRLSRDMETARHKPSLGGEEKKKKRSFKIKHWKKGKGGEK